MRALTSKSIGPAALMLVASLVLASAAQAHIEIKPKRAPAGERTSLTFDVENESATAGTRKLDIKLPQGITSVSPRSVRGWKTRLRRSGAQIERLIFTAPAGKE